MNLVESVLLVFHIVVAAAICGFVLLQHGKGADMGAAFGSGASGSLFGAAGSANFLSRTTGILAAVFFASSLGLTWFGSTRGAPSGLMQQGVVEKSVPGTPEVPAPSGALPGAAPSSTPAAGPTPAPATSPDLPKTQPAPAGSKAGEVPK